MAKIRLTVKNPDESARRVFNTREDLVERLEYLAAVEGWDEVVVPGRGTYSILGSNLVSVAATIRGVASWSRGRRHRG